VPDRKPNGHKKIINLATIQMKNFRSIN